MTRRRARSTAKPYRDPMMNDLTGMIEEWKPRIKGEVQVTPRQAIQALQIDEASEPCFICNGEPHTVERYMVPEELAKLNQVAIYYTLCVDCRLDITTSAKVRERLAARLREENEVMGVN